MIAYQWSPSPKITHVETTTTNTSILHYPRFTYTSPWWDTPLWYDRTDTTWDMIDILFLHETDSTGLYPSLTTLEKCGHLYRQDKIQAWGLYALDTWKHALPWVEHIIEKEDVCPMFQYYMDNFHLGQTSRSYIFPFLQSRNIEFWARNLLPDHLISTTQSNKFMDENWYSYPLPLRQTLLKEWYQQFPLDRWILSPKDYETWMSTEPIPNNLFNSDTTIQECLAWMDWLSSTIQG